MSKRTGRGSRDEGPGPEWQGESPAEPPAEEEHHAEDAEPQRDNPRRNGSTPGERQDEEPPVCPYHKRRCKANRTEPFFTRYYCPVAGCSYSHKQPRPQMRRRLDFSRRGNPFDARADE